MSVDALKARITLPPIALAASIHLAWALFALWVNSAAWPMELSTWLWVEGLCAAFTAHYLGLPRWWFPINLLFLPTAHALAGMQLPPILFLTAFGVLLLTNWGALLERVPLVISSPQCVASVAALLPKHPAFEFIDLGCGTGSFLARLSQLRPDGKYTGLEIAPLNYAISRGRALGKASWRARWSSLWSADLSRYDVVYAYLSPVPMPELWRKARSEMKSGSLFISNTFAVPGVAPTRTVEVGDRRGSTLYVWRM